MKTLVIGSALLEITIKLDELPKSGSESVGEERKISIGGCAYNIANTLKNLESEYSLFVPLGEGFIASQIREQLKIDGHQIILNDKSDDNGFCISLIEKNAQRSFITNRGVEKDFKEEWFENINFENFQNIYFDGYKMESEASFILLRKLEKIKEKTNIFFCPGPMFSKIKQNILESIFCLNPILHLNEKEIIDFTKLENTEEAIKKIYSLNKNKIILTLGNKGCLYFDGINFNYFKSVIEENAVDTSGAGDAHISTIIAMTSKGKTFEQACQIANKVAKKSVTQLGPKFNLNLDDLDI